MDKLLILNKIKEYYSFKNDTKFAEFLGVTPQVLSNWKSRNTFDVELIYTKCLVFSPEWLLTGKGEMLKNREEVQNVVNEPEENYGIDYKELYLREKEIVDILKKQIRGLESQLGIKRNAG